MNSDENENNGANTQAQSTMPGGIYSTPDLSVDANNISNPQPSNEQSRVASIFANTDAGQRTQRLNDAMANTAAPATTEDVVVNNDPKRKSKMPIILAVIVIIAVVVSVGSYLITNLIKDNTPPVVATPKEAFESYYSYLVDGPEEWRDKVEKESSSDYFLFGVGASDLTVSDVNKYDNELRNKFRTFSESAKDIEDVTSKISSYGNLLNLSILYSNAFNEIDNILDKYVNQDANAAYEYINSVSNVSTDETTLKNLPGLIRDYLQNELKLLQFYKENNCISGANINYLCVASAGANSEVYNSLSSSQQDLDQNISYYGQYLVEIFSEETDELKQIMEKNNEN